MDTFDFYGLDINKLTFKDWGLFHVSVEEAAELVAVDMWVESEIEAAPELDNEDVEPSDPRLKVALSKIIDLFIGRLIVSIENSRLEAAAIRRDFQEKILPSHTYIQIGDLEDWLEARGYLVGVAFEEWREIREMIGGEMQQDLRIMETIGKGGIKAIKKFTYQKSLLKHNGEISGADVTAAHKDLLEFAAENVQLKIKLAEVEKNKINLSSEPIHTRERNTLLSIIGVLCKEAKIDISRPSKAAGCIESTAAIMGVSLGNSTIEAHLKKVPDSLAARMK
jgi:hypothetical protein